MIFRMLGQSETVDNAVPNRWRRTDDHPESGQTAVRLAVPITKRVCCCFLRSNASEKRRYLGDGPLFSFPVPGINLGGSKRSFCFVFCRCKYVMRTEQLLFPMLSQKVTDETVKSVCLKGGQQGEDEVLVMRPVVARVEGRGGNGGGTSEWLRTCAVS